jgi:hypothetical protein
MARQKKSFMKMRDFFMLQKIKKKDDRLLRKEAIFIGKFDFHPGLFFHEK